MALEIPSDNSNWVVDEELGLYLPANVSSSRGIRAFDHPFNRPDFTFVRQGDQVVEHRDGVGTYILFDNETGIAFWPAYASGFDDMLMRSMVQGYMANTGPTPVPITLLSTIVTKIQEMVGTWVNTVTGRTSPVEKTLDLMSRAQDSQFGSAEFVRLFMGSLLVDNRGAMGAQVPLESIAFDSWDQYGMEAELISGETNVKEPRYVLRMTQENFRENQGLYMLDGLSCLPTGNKEYPFWFRTWSAQENKAAWVLIHRDFGFQLLNNAGGKNNQYPGFGQSSTWRFAPYAVKHMAIERQDWEHLMNQPMRGIVWVSGLDFPTQFADQLEAYQEDLESSDTYFYPGVFFGGSRGENSDIKLIPWSEPPAGFTQEGWRNEWVDNLAAAFHLNVTHLVVRLGEGAMTQSDVASSLEAETAIAAFREKIEALWNHVAPPRVMVDVIWLTDRLKRYQTDTAKELGLFIARVNKPIAQTGEDQVVLSRGEIRGLLEQYIGIPIPELEEDETTDPEGKDPDLEEFYEHPAGRMYGRVPMPELLRLYTRDRVFHAGNIVGFLHERGKYGRIKEVCPYNDWVWIKTNDDYMMLVDGSRLWLISSIMDHITWAEEKAEKIALHRSTHTYDGDDMLVPYSFQPGDRAKTELGTPVTVMGSIGDLVDFKYDWDGPNIEYRTAHISELTPMGFEPEGEPLDEVDEVDLDPEIALQDARDLWGDIAPDELEDLL